MEFTDTHTHLYLKEFENDRDEVVQRAINNGVTKLLLPNIDSGSITGMMEMCSKYPDICKPMIGLHPGSVDHNFTKELRIIESWLGKDRFIGIGEIGIDLYWDKTFKEEQIEAFRIQVQWAKQNNLPIIIHARESFSEIFEVLEKLADKNLKGVFHSFTGNEDHVKIINEFGFYFGINGIVTYKNGGLSEIVEIIPPEKLLLETDSPYLPPVPKRGQRNESAYLLYTADKVAQIYGTTVEKLAVLTSQNAKELFTLI